MLLSRYHALVAIFLVFIFIFSAALSIENKSSTYDEPAHLVAGASYWQTGDPRLNWDHPPLARLAATVPVLFIDFPRIPQIAPIEWQKNITTPEAVTFTSQLIQPIEERLLVVSRVWMALLFGALLGFLIYSWSVQLFGPTAALIPLALYSFSPTLLAHAPLAMTDFPLMVFYFAAVYFWWNHLRDPTVGRLTLACLAVGAAFVTKHSAVALVPTFLLLGSIFIFLPRDNPVSSGYIQRTLVVAGSLITVAIVTLFMINAVYLFDGSLLTIQQYQEYANELDANTQSTVNKLAHYWPSQLPLPVPYYYLHGVLSRLSNPTFYRSYFMGVFTWSGGWSNYFSVLLLFKLSIPTLLFIGIGLAKGAQESRRNIWDLAFLILPPTIFLLMASATPINIGIRHVLPTLPFLLLLSGYAAKLKSLPWRMVTGLLILTNAVSSIAAHPHYLSYFNFLGGGQDRGWGVSNYDDLGQDGKGLLLWLNKHRIKRIPFGGFGWSGTILTLGGIQLTSPPCKDTGELVAIHASRLLMAYSSAEEAQCYTWMRLRQPDEKIGYSIFLYNTKNIPRPPPPADLTLFNQALDLQVNGRNLESIPLYRQYISKEPDYYQAHFNLACALKDTGQCTAAIPEFERTLELWPGYKEAHLHLTLCYRELGRPEEGRRHEEEYRKK